MSMRFGVRSAKVTAETAPRQPAACTSLHRRPVDWRPTQKQTSDNAHGRGEANQETAVSRVLPAGAARDTRAG